MAELKQLLERLSDADIEFVIVGGRLSFLTELGPGSTVRDLYLETDAGAIDLLTSITGVGDYGRVRAQASQIELFGRPYLVMSLPDLIAAKRALGREKDLLSARELEAIAERS